MRPLLLLACALSFLAAAPVHAAPPSRESVEQLLSVIDMQKTYDATFDAMRKSVEQAFTNMPQLKSLTPEQRKGFDSGMSRMYDLMHQELDWSKLKPEFEQMYIDTFTQEEVDGLLAFYRSPAGKALVEKTPLLMSKSMQITQSRMQNLMPRVMQIMQDSMREATVQSPAAASAAH
jgi:uncharacterized protein